MIATRVAIQTKSCVRIKGARSDRGGGGGGGRRQSPDGGESSISPELVLGQGADLHAENTRPPPLHKSTALRSTHDHD